MDCELVRQLLTFARPGATELDAADVAMLERHLADCATCRAHSRDERKWDDGIARLVQAVQVPADGRARLDQRLRLARNSWRGRNACIAASVLVVTGLTWWIWPAPQFNADTVIADAYNQVGNREGVEIWLTQQNSRFAFPPRMNARHLVRCERVDFHGVKAPVLTFVRQNAIATVAVLSSRQFANLASLSEGRVAENSVGTVLIIRDPNSADVVYVIEVINGPVELFYNEGEATVTLNLR